MFGATPRCPRCQKLVYAAEQIVGPGRKFYHKPCLACTSCGRRLDSYSLLEHDDDPYCKPCHLKNFGTRDLRHQNLPFAQRARSASIEETSPPSPPTNSVALSSTPVSFTGTNTSTGTRNGLPRLQPTRALSPTSSTFPRPISRPGSSIGNLSSPMNTTNIISEESDEGEGLDSPVSAAPPTDGPEDAFSPSSSFPSNTGRPGLGTIPRTVPLSLDHSAYMAKHKTTKSLGSINTTSLSSTSSSPYSPSSRMTPAAAALNLLEREGISQLRQTPTGTRYGNALNVGNSNGVHMTGAGGSSRKWGGSTPVCPKCSKSVYFAEQVKAIGKTYHKYCLRCTECGTTLDSTKLRDHDEQPYCVRCYNKLYGPQGSGYALLGKAGG